jgi:hypothetical protein
VKEVLTLPRVASVYRDACEKGLPPTKTVALTFGITGSMASKWVMATRGAGLLAPTKQGVAPVNKEARRCPTCGADRSRWRRQLE